MSNVVFTIGHSTHSLERLIELLQAHKVTAVADVRSQPYSRLSPYFNREFLRNALKSERIAYVFLGRELGARTDDANCYVDGKVQYDRLARTASFQEGLTRVVNGASRYRIALLCAEKDPLTCHRTILVCRHLVARGLQAAHILGSGRIESHDAALDRLLREVGVDSEDFFRSRDELIAEAYEKRGQQIAYVDRSSTPEVEAQRGTR